MKVELNLYASLKRYMPDGTHTRPFFMEEREGTTVRDILRQLKLPGDLVKIIFLNGLHAGEDAILKDGDRIGIFPPVAGG